MKFAKIIVRNYIVNDKSVMAELNILFENTEIRIAPFRYRLKAYSNDPSWIGWDFLFKVENEYYSFYLRSMDSKYFTISLNVNGSNTYRLQGDMKEFRNQVEAILQKGVDDE